MGIKGALVEFAAVFAVALVITVIVTALWNLIVHGAVRIDWETSFRLAILFGVIVPWMEMRRRRRD